MNASFPIFTYLVLVVLAGHAEAQFPLGTGAASGLSPAQRAGTAPDSISGDALLRRSLANIDVQPSIAANVRQKVAIEGISAIGAGIYRQQGRGVGRKLCLELELQAAGGKPSTLRQVCDGQNLWTYQDLTDSKSLVRVDLAQLSSARPKSTGNSNRAAVWLALGGVPNLLESLLAKFDFPKVTESRLGEVRVWTIEGTWKRPILLELLPSQKSAIEAGQRVDSGGLPPYLPDRVVLHIGCDDFFPYRFEYWRDEPAHRKSSAQDRARLLTVIEFYEVQFGIPIEASQFTFAPGDLQAVDGTQAFLDKFGLEIALPAGANQTQRSRRE